MGLPYSQMADYIRLCPMHSKPKMQGGGAMMRVLVVDDCRDSVLILSRLLERCDHEVQAARSGSEALALASVFRPDAVFLDLWMPKMDGYELANRLRHTEGLERIRIIALSGVNPNIALDQNAGIDVHLVKPARLEDLLEAMEGTCQAEKPCGTVNCAWSPGGP